MKTLKSMMRLSALGGTVIAGLCLAQQAQAATGFCTATGGVKNYQFTFSPTMTDPAQNITGKIITDAQGANWNGGENYAVKCDCPNPPTMGASYISAKSPLPPLGTLAGGGTGTYFQLNPYLAVAAKVYVGGRTLKYFDVPFSNQSNQYTTADQQPCNYDYLSGSQGKIDLYFLRPFVGVSTIPYTKLVDVFVSSINGVSSPNPVAAVYMSGTVTVPQNCDISPSPVNVDFGTIMSNSFKTAGAMPNGFTKVNKQLTLACRNISNGVVINLSFQTTPDPVYGDALKTDNSSIAVRIEDKNGNIISPNNGALPVNLNYSTQQGTTEMNLYPINTTGSAPSVGIFNATATIKVEIQ